MERLPLPLHLSEDFIRKHLERETGKTIYLLITDNSTNMLSIKWEGKSLNVRMHRIFLSAGKEVLHELADFIKKRNIRTPQIRKFINVNASHLRMNPPKKITLRTKGSYYDLLDIFNSLNEEYFMGRISSPITWGRATSKHAARKRTLGSYSQHTGLIRINPILDTGKVPRYFLEFIVYHEMLHAEMGVENSIGRRSVHPRKFREREKQFTNYEKALGWEKKRWC
ncbi:MAG: hypothetical protein C4538_03290 [Nitrospiraceae bacterium]|nr:MAG: hypothetical protein C4538_03290 [Nitrospiraceae bacterium]